MIRIDIPGRGLCEISHVVSDYTGTHAFAGTLRPGVKARLAQLAALVQVHFLTSDTFGTAKQELADLPVTLHILDGEHHDEQKRAYVLALDPRHVAAFGNGNNDRLLLKTVRDAGGLAIAVDNGEGCAIDALLAANLVIHGSENALDLLLDGNRCKATLRS
jgi:soluble P-type ATPase